MYVHILGNKMTVWIVEKMKKLCFQQDNGRNHPAECMKNWSRSKEIIDILE